MCDPIRWLLSEPSRLMESTLETDFCSLLASMYMFYGRNCVGKFKISESPKGLLGLKTHQTEEEGGIKSNKWAD